MSVSAPTLSRLSGLALLLGGLLGTASVALHPADGNMVDPINVPIHLALYAAVMLILLGLPALCGRLASASGVPALAGTVLLFFGLAFEDPLHSVVAFTVAPALAANPATRPLLDAPPPGVTLPLMMAAGFAIFAGLIVLAIAIVRTGALPRWLAAPMLATVILIPLGFAVAPLREVGPALLYLTIAGLGYPLAAQPAHAAAGAERPRSLGQAAYS